MSLSILEIDSVFDLSPIPVGSLIYSPLVVPPTGTIPTDGAYYDPKSAEYKDLFYVIGYRFGKRASDSFFQVPNIPTEYHLRSPGFRDQHIFAFRGNTLMSHSHGSAATTNDGSHTHSFFMERIFDNGTSPTTIAQGTGAATTASVTEAMSLSAVSTHNHSAWVYSSGGTTQPPNVGMFLYLVYRRS